MGQHNVHNALAAIAACEHVGVSPLQSIKALATFQSVKRRLEVRGTVNNVTVYDDFAHHPSAITSTLAGLRHKIGATRMIVIAEFASYTMRAGVHVDELPSAFKEADMVFILKPTNANWDFNKFASGFSQSLTLCDTVDEIVTDIKQTATANDHSCVMSNRGFGGIHEKILAVL